MAGTKASAIILSLEPLKESVMKKAAENFCAALLVVLMLAVVLTFLAPRFGWRMDALFSGSMEPQLKVGGVVITRPVEAEEIKARDIITFHSSRRDVPTSHRVVAIEQGSQFRFLTKGDANEDADPFIVPAQNVVGKVCFHIPYFGYATQFVKTPLGLLLTLGLPGLIIVVMELRNIWHIFSGDEVESKYHIRGPKGEI